MKPLFTHPHTVRLHETDGAGILFHAHIFTIAHIAHDEMLAAAGLSIAEIVNNHPFSLPLVHIEADFSHPIRLGEQLILQVYLAKMGEHSFTLKTRFEELNGTTTPRHKAEVTTVHVSIDQESGSSIPLPSIIQNLLNNGV